MSIFDSDQWESAVSDLRNKAAEFSQLFDIVERSAPQSPELARTRERVLSSGRTIKATIERVTGMIDATYAKWQDWFGNDADPTLQGLGILPLIPVAVITGAVGGVVYGIKQLRGYLSENDRMESLKQEGYSTEQAMDIMRGQAPGIGPSIERGLKTLGPWIAAGAVMYFFAQRKFKF